MSAAGYVLVVDDEPGIRGLIGAVLQDAGYRVREAGNAGQALEIVGSERPLAAVLDYMMAGLSGVELGAELRRVYGKELPLVFMSAAQIPRNELRKVDAYLYLTKPFEIDDLVEAVHSATSSRQPHALLVRDGAEELPHGDEQAS